MGWMVHLEREREALQNKLTRVMNEWRRKKKKEEGETDLDGSFNVLDERRKQSVVEGEEREGEGEREFFPPSLHSSFVSLPRNERERENEEGEVIKRG